MSLSFRASHAGSNTGVLKNAAAFLESLERRTLLTTYVVNSVADTVVADGQLTLREAITAANNDAIVADAPAGNGADRIEFSSNLPGSTITLTGGQLQIANDLTIMGPGPGRLSVDADGLSRVFSVWDDNDDTKHAVFISGMTITGGSDIFGAGLYNSEFLSLDNNVIASNTATGNDGGGGIWHAAGTLNITNCEISNNTTAAATFNRVGGGGMFLGASTIITRTRILSNTSRNLGGGVFASRCLLRIDDSVISGNTAEDNGGGGVYNFDGGVTIERTTISSNTAAGDGDGGGIRNLSVNGTTLILKESTVSGNASENDGGGIYSSSSTTSIENSTISGNTANGGGGGIANFGGALTLNFVTVANNKADINQNDVGTGGGIYTNSQTTLRNSIVSGNFQKLNVTSNLVGAFRADNSLVGNTSTAYSLTTGSIGNIIAVNPLLGPLADNGGPTKTHALGIGSPAIDKGGVATGFATDQRGEGYKRVSGAAADMGAFESGSRPFAVLNSATRRLDVAGTSSNDRIGVTTQGNTLTVALGDNVLTFSRQSIDFVDINAGAGNDRVDASAQTKTLYVAGGNGDDTIIGGSGDDTITGGAGRNRLYGGPGIDRLNGSAGRDFLRGGEGDDRLYGNDGNDDLAGESGIDRLFGGDGDDALKGGGSNDKLYGEAGADTLVGEGQRDLLIGGSGNDLFGTRDDLIDTLDGGAGSDRADRDDIDNVLAIEAFI